MRLPLTLSLYIGRQFLVNFVVVLGVFAALIVVIDAMELIRRSYSKDVPLSIILEMALLKLPHMIQEVVPFSILLGSILTFTRLTRTSELVVARAAGISVWQFLMPAIITSFFLGVFLVTVFNPLASVMLKGFEQVENRYLRGNASMMAISESGLWLRQKNEKDEGKTVIHALRVSQEDMRLQDVTIFMFTHNNKFIRRIDAERAQLKNGFWHLQNTVLTAPDMLARFRPEYRLETTINEGQIQESFASPETLSFWELPHFIRTLEDAGFSALKHRYYWHSVLALPIFLCALVYIAATFSLSPPRRGKTGLLIVGGIGAGFLIHFVTGLVSALGMAGTIPVIFAAWAPVGVSMLIGVSLMLHLEDG